MADIESNIDLNIDASGALNTLKALQKQISSFQQTMAKTGAISNARLSDMQQNLVSSINATGQFTASIQRVRTTTESFTNALEKNKLSMGQYFRYSMGATKNFGRAFQTEFDTIDKVARERVKTLQTQYIKLGRDASGAMQAIAVRPQVLDMKDLGTQTAIAAQKQQLFNQLMTQGSTNLLNFGKNTQWAGRQLMVGFTIPLGIMGAAAAKEFKAIEEQVIRLERVYGDFTTTMADTQAMTESIKGLADEFTKYGVAVSKTIGLAADAAAMGSTGAQLIAQVAEANRLAVLGGVGQEQALETAISLTSAFGVAADDLAKKTDFLNAVENQTITSIEDLTEAIPKAGPVVQQLGGDVEDLTFFLTAMREGGINASESANALKSGLASLINPTGEAAEMLAGFGINLQGIVEANKGDVKGIVIDFAKALDTLDPLNRAQAIEQLFGKFQFSRLSTLFQNVIKEGSQAQRVLELTNTSSAELAALSERELGKVEASPLFQFQGAIERFRAALAPVGEEFMKAVTPLINFGTDVLNAFNNLEGGVKQFAVIAVGAIGAIGPVLLMTFGLLANGIANIIKGALFVRNGFKGVGDQSNILTNQLGYMNSEQLEAAAVAASLNQVHNTLIQTFTSEAAAIRNLAAAYGQAVAVQGSFAGPILTGGGGTRSAGKPVKKFADGVKMVPGYGNKDSQPAMLMPGEAVIPKKMVQKYGPLISAMVDGNIPGYENGVKPPKKYNVGAAGIRMSLPEHLESLYGAAAAEAELARATAAATETEKALLAMRERGIEVTDAQIKSATQLDRSHVIQVSNDQKQTKEAWGKGAWSVQTGGENNLILGSLQKSAKNREVYFEYLKKTGATERQIANIQKKITQGIALTEKELQIQGKALRAIGEDWESGKLGKSRVSKTFGMYAGAVGAGQLGREAVAATQSPAVLAGSQRTPAQIKAAQEVVDGNVALADETKKQTKAMKKETAKVEERVKDPKRVAAGLKAAETRRLNALNAAAALEEKQARQSRLRGAMSPGKFGVGGMVAGGALSAMSMVGGPVGDVAGAVGGPLMAISGLVSVLGMLPGPAGIAVGALGLVAGAFLFLQNQANQANEAARKVAQSLSSGKEAMDKFAEATGSVNPVDEIARMRAEERAGRKLDAGEESFGAQYLSSESGQALVQGAQEALDKLDGKAVAEKVARQLATAVSGGMMSAEQARSIADNMSVALKDSAFSANVDASLLTLIGPDGKNVLENPLELETKLIQMNAEEIQSNIKELSNTPAPIWWFGATDDEMNQRAANEAEVAQSIRDQVDLERQALATAELRHNQKIEELKAANDLKGIEEENIKYEKEVAQLRGQSSEAMKAIAEELNKRDTKTMANVSKGGVSGPQYVADQSTAGMIDQLEQMTKDAMASLSEAQKKVADSTIEALANTTQLQSGTKATLLATVSVENVEAFNDLKSMFDPSKKEDAQVYDYIAKVSTEVGVEQAGTVAEVFASFGEGNEEMVTNFMAKVDVNAEEGMEMINTLQLMKDAMGEDFKISMFVDTQGNPTAELKQVSDAYSRIQGLINSGGPIVLEQITEIDWSGVSDMGALQGWFDSIPKEQQKYFLEHFVTVYASITDDEIDAYMKKSGVKGVGSTTETKRAPGGKLIRETVGGVYTDEQRTQYKAAAVADQVQALTNEMAKLGLFSGGSSGSGPSAPPPPTGGGGGGGGAKEPEKPPTSFLDSVVKDMRDFVRGAQGLTENFVDSMNAIRSATTSAFGGLSQQLRGLGLGEDVIKLMTGMSKEEWDTYKGQFFDFDAAGNITGFKTDLAVIATRIQAITLGKFVDQQQAAFMSTVNQSAAMTKLVGLGMSYADSYKIIEDAAVAAAIANAKSADEIRKIIDLTNRLSVAQTVADAVKNLSNSLKETETTANRLDGVKQFAANLTNAEMSAIMANDELKTMFDNFENLDITQLKVLRDALLDIDKKKKLEIEIKMQTVEGMQDLFSDGFSKAMEQFSAREQEIKIKFSGLKDPFENIIKSASQQIEDMKEAPGGLDDLEADLQRIGEQEVDINKRYDERFKALDSIAKINDRIAAQQRSQLSLAEALSMGDIAAAARAAQEMRAQDAAQAVASQREALERSKELELENLMGNMGMTRAQLEERIRDLKQQIFEIEEAQLEPAQYQVDLLTRQEEKQIASLTILGKTKEEWENIKNGIDLARTNSEQYKEAINLAFTLVEDLADKWLEIEKPKKTIYTIVEETISKKEDEARRATPPPPPPPPPPVASTAPAPAGPVKDQAWIDNMARRVIRGEFGNGQARRNNLGADYQIIQDRVNAHYYSGRRLFAMGGLVQAYAKGGKVVAKEKVGTIHIPRKFYGQTKTMANGGMVGDPMGPAPFRIGTDSVPAMLTPGEFVVRKWAVDKFGVDNLNSINQGNFGSGSVYNYNMSVNVKSDANADDIARTVIAQIKRVDAQRIRGNRF